MLDSLIFANLNFRRGGLFAHNACDRPVLRGRDADVRGEKVGEMALRGKSKLVADVGHRCLRTRQPIERPFHPHRVCIEGRCYAGVFPKKLEEMRTGKAGITCHRAKFDTLGEAIVKKAERFADAEIHGLLRPQGNPRPAARCPRFVKTGVEKLVQIPMDDPITRGCDERMGKARANRAERRSDVNRVVAEAKAAAALLVAIEPAITDIRYQEDPRLLFGTGLKRMWLPRVDRYGRGFVDQMRNIRNRHDRRWAAEVDSQMTFAVGVSTHRLIQPVHRHTAERSMTDRQRGAHVTPPYAQPIVLSD